jgi:hypothetical protein
VSLPKITSCLDEASVWTSENRLTVTSGRIRRDWQWVKNGLATWRVQELKSGYSWETEPVECDWELPDGHRCPLAELRSMDVWIQDDEGFTTRHICVEAEIAYPHVGLLVKFAVWVYPGASGIRTALAVMRTGQHSPPIAEKNQLLSARVERIPAGKERESRRMFGYYNDTQNRNDAHLDILKEEIVTEPANGLEMCDWASAFCLENNVAGVALVKESHKCVNQQGHVTGGFVYDREEALSCTGWGLLPHEVSSETFTPAWATWCLAWPAGDLNRALAFKSFERFRYPADPSRDVYVQANTWGSGATSLESRLAASEQSVLREIEICADLGIDVLQIDDGWQVPPGDDFLPGENGWNPHPQPYPKGWGAVRSMAEKLGVRLGLWAAAMPIKIDELKRNQAQGGFVQFKLDFAVLDNRAAIDSLMRKVREFVRWTGHRVRINWDVTENPPRFGYFFAREYGSLFLENRKPTHPQSVIYRPHTVLRDVWQLSKYLNIQRVQCSIQDIDRVDRELSDAWQHSHAYAVAIALMGLPLFFLETKYYTEQAKVQVRSLLRIYREHRGEIHRGLVHPVGAKPDNGSWTGFQSHLMDEQAGYLMLFRERCNQTPHQSLALGWLSEGSIEVTNLVAGTCEVKTVEPGGRVSFHIEKAPDFLFCRYTSRND